MSVTVLFIYVEGKAMRGFYTEAALYRWVKAIKCQWFLFTHYLFTQSCLVTVYSALISYISKLYRQDNFNDILCWSWVDADLYKFRDFHVLATTYLSYILTGNSESSSFEIQVLRTDLFLAAFKSGFPTSFFPKTDFLYQILSPGFNWCLLVK